MFAAKCPTLEQLQAYTVGRLPDGLSDALVEHLDVCAPCQSNLATLDDVDDTLVARLQQQPPADALFGEPECVEALVRARSVVDAPSHNAPADQETLSRVGEQLGEYRLLEELGRGGMGRVYKALQTKLDRIVALKVLPSGRAGDERAIARFEREMRAIGRLDHPHIVHAYDAREINGNPVLVMEYVEGMDVGRVLQLCDRLTTANACELARQAAIGLQYAHDNGLVHRDVKPSNLMLTPQGNVKLLDLGLARFPSGAAPGDEMTGSGQPMGTADYIAPEQVSDSRAVDIRADIYSLGCTLYKLLTGHAPFSGPERRGTFEKLTAHVHEPAPRIRDVDASLPEPLVTLLQRMLAKLPDDRPSIPIDVANALAPLCAGSDLAALSAEAEHLKKRREAAADLSPRVVDPPAKPPVHESIASHGARTGGWFWSGIAALMLLAGAGGFALGVVVTIKFNGKATQVTVPDGSNVTIHDDARVDVELPPTKPANAISRAPQSTTGIPDAAEAKPSRPKTMMVYLDADGFVTYDRPGSVPFGRFVGDPGRIRPGHPPELSSLAAIIASEAISDFEIMADNGAPSSSLLTLQEELAKAPTFRSVQVKHRALPVRHVSRLDFRIAATRKADGVDGLTDAQFQEYVNKLTSGGGIAAPDVIPHDEFAWFEYRAGPMKDVLSWSVANTQYVLLSTRPDQVMSWNDGGERAWQIVAAAVVDDELGNPAVDLELDDVGGRRMGELTESHMQQPLAILVNNKVIMAPSIQSKMTNRIRITGMIDWATGDNLIHSLTAARTVSDGPTEQAPTDSPDDPAP